jgi:hypothetical protein
MGRSVHLQRTNQDDTKALARAAGASNRATPEGLMIYWNPRARWIRVIRNNAFILIWLNITCGMVIDPKTTVVLVTLLALFVLSGWVTLWVINLRKKAEARRPVHRPALSTTNRAKAIFAEDETTVGSRPRLVVEEKPQLEGVPKTVLAGLLSSDMGCSVAELQTRLTMTPDRGEIRLPDSFAARLKQREPIEETIEAHTSGPVRFTWTTTETPRTLSWIPIVIHRLPDMVRFRDWLGVIEALPMLDFGVGVTAEQNMYVSSHAGDTPWNCRFAGSGTGKSIGFLVKAVQIIKKDPTAELFCVDTKQVSFKYLHGIPGVHVYDNPVSEMGEIWDVFPRLAGVMRSRYAAVREHRGSLRDFHNIWLLVDEGNDLGASLKSYWKNVKEGDTANPPIWGESIGPLLRQGREARVFGEWMFQDLRDQAMGGESLKMAFGEFGAAGFLPQQFSRTIGNPAPECLEGPGKILMCRGNKRTWVQGFYDDPEWLRSYALEAREGQAA